MSGDEEAVEALIYKGVGKRVPLFLILHKTNIVLSEILSHPKLARVQIFHIS